MLISFNSNGRYIDCSSLTYPAGVVMRVVTVITVIRREYSQFSIILCKADPPPGGAPWATFLRISDLQLWHSDLLN
jgi:hypothetical protein